MLIEFSVSNFRSFREKQTFSMVAAPRLGKKNNLFKPSVPGEKLPNLLKLAAIYGPNATGKSNLVKAFEVFEQVSNYNSITDGPFLPVSPFRFDPLLQKAPSIFEVHFIKSSRRYEYYLEVTRERIIAERLITIIKGKESLLFSREYKDQADEYVFGENLEGGSLLHEAWKNLTGSKALFIAQAVTNSNESLNQLRGPFEWLKSNLRANPRDLEKYITAYHFIKNKHPDTKFGEDLASFLTELDLPISKVKFENKTRKDSLPEIEQQLEFDDVDKLEAMAKSFKTTFTHTTALGNADFDLSEESDGTKSLAGFSFIWKMLTLGDPTIFIIDELDSSLHPKIVECLVKQMHALDLNSQFIFTTHDTHLMDTKLLRRDQIWVTERDRNGATKLHSFYDYEGRESEDIEKRYYEGRYRGLPIVG